jgi:hypothetical protein
MVFRNNRCEYISKLPPLVATSGTSTRKRYADATGVRDRWVRRRQRRDYLFPRSFWGIPVEADGRMWGVLVIDSRDAELSDVDKIKELFNPLGACLSKLLAIPSKS